MERVGRALVPHRHAQPAAGPQDARHLGQRDLLPAHMEQHEVRDDRVERARSERQRLGGADDECGLRDQRRRRRDHRGGDVHAGHHGAQGRGPRAHVAGATADVQEPRAAASCMDPGRVEDRVRCPDGDRRPEGVVRSLRASQPAASKASNASGSKPATAVGSVTRRAPAPDPVG